MNAIQKAKSSYGSKNILLKTSRRIEYEIFANVTRHLEVHSMKNKIDFSNMAYALYQNRKLWTMLASDVASQNNSLPHQIRAQIFYLSEFVNQHTRKVLSGDSTTKPLTEINLSMMRGLSDLEGGG